MEYPSLNDEGKGRAMRQKIEESCCFVFCIHETKMEDINPHSFRRLAPKRFTKFAFNPSRGVSGGGILIGWNDSLLQGTIQEVNLFSITVDFASRLSADHWKLTIVYGPCHGPDRTVFTNWLSSLDISSTDNWMLMRDFNFYRSIADRNKPGGMLQI
jgi:hypothetical protein